MQTTQKTPLFTPELLAEFCSFFDELEAEGVTFQQTENRYQDEANFWPKPELWQFIQAHPLFAQLNPSPKILGLMLFHFQTWSKAPHFYDLDSIPHDNNPELEAFLPLFSELQEAHEQKRAAKRLAEEQAAAEEQGLSLDALRDKRGFERRAEDSSLRAKSLLKHYFSLCLSLDNDNRAELSDLIEFITEAAEAAAEARIIKRYESRILELEAWAQEIGELKEGLVTLEERLNKDLLKGKF